MEERPATDTGQIPRPLNFRQVTAIAENIIFNFCDTIMEIHFCDIQIVVKCTIADGCDGVRDCHFRIIAEIGFQNAVPDLEFFRGILAGNFLHAVQYTSKMRHIPGNTPQARIWLPPRPYPYL